MIMLGCSGKKELERRGQGKREKKNSLTELKRKENYKYQTRGGKTLL